MITKNIEFDRIEEMIKKKIMVKESPQKHKFNTQKGSPIKFRTKQFHKSQNKRNHKNTNNDIVIMNMPPPTSRIDFLNDDIHTNSPNRRKFSQNIQTSPKLFTNQFINSGLQKCNSIKQRNHLQNNFFNQFNHEKQSFMELKRYNSMNIRLSAPELSNNQGQFISPGMANSLRPLLTESVNNHKVSVASIYFKPSLRELLVRTNKDSNIESKLRKSEFNYQRAINTSSQSRKKAFQKVLYSFKSSLAKKLYENQQSQKNKNVKPPLQENIKSREISTSSRSRIGSPQSNKRVKPKQQDPCRPWSANKKPLIKLQSTQEQNPLQFYSINQQF